MALSILYTVRDRKNATATMEINVPQAVTPANAILFASEMSKILDPLVTGAITRIGIVLSVPLPVTLQSVPSVGSDVEEGAFAQFRTSLNNLTSFRIPTFNESFVSQSSRDVDQTATPVAGLIAAMTGGIDVAPLGGTGTVVPSDKRNEDIVAINAFKEQFQSSRA